MFTFPAIDPDEKYILTFRFAPGLSAGEFITSSVLDVKALNNKDALAASHFGVHSIQTTQVMIPVSGCKAGVNYHLRVLVETNNPDKKLAISVSLPCREE